MAAALPAIGAGAGLLGSIIGSAPQGRSRTQAIGRPEDVTNVNPYTGGFWNQMQGMLGAYSPTANIGTLQGLTGGINQITGDVISPFGASLAETANILSNESRRQIASDFSQNNALNSGAALSAITRGGMLPISQAVTNIAQMQSNLGGGLLSSALGQMGNAYGGAMQGLTAYAAPEWWQPTYQTYGASGGMNPFSAGLSFLGGALPGLAGYYGGNQYMLANPNTSGMKM